MKRLAVRIPPDVEKQILDQVLYIAADSIDNALAWEQRLRAAINSISDARGHPIDQDASDRVGQTIRKLIFERTYLIHYRINQTAKAIEVVNFRHGARLPGRAKCEQSFGLLFGRIRPTRPCVNTRRVRSELMMFIYN